jgi:hypothetical protein
VEWDDDMVTKLTYADVEVTIVKSAVEEEMIRFIDMTGLTDMEMMITISQPILTRIEEHGSLAAFSLSLQQTALQLIDARLRKNL